MKDHDPVADVWEHGSPYDRYVGRWSRRVATRFLSWLDIAPGRRWLDVGCGTGALSAAILEHCSPSVVVAVEPSEGFRDAAKENLGPRVEVYRGSADAIPLDDALVDVVVSGLVLNFVENPHAALVEMQRVTGDGGIVAAYVWDYSDRMEFMRMFWDTAVERDPRAETLHEGHRFPLCREAALLALFTDAGLEAVRLGPIDIETAFESFDDLWQPFLGGQGPAPAYVMSLDDEARKRLKDRLQARVPVREDGRIVLTARAWAVRGHRPKRADEHAQERSRTDSH